MGRLAAARRRAAARRCLPNGKRLRQLVLAWLLPLMVTVAILFGVHAKVKADPAPTTTELAQYLQTHQLNVATEPVGDYQQIYYLYDSRPVVLTSTNYNHSHAVSSGEYVAWEGTIDGSSQIFVYDILTDALTQLTSTGTNETPFIYHDQVTWQTWDGTGWQVYYYDGTNIRQITTEPYPSVGASTDGQRIIYAEQISSDDWKAQSYDIASGQTTVIREGDQASTAYPAFASDGTITTAFIPQ